MSTEIDIADERWLAVPDVERVVEAASSATVAVLDKALANRVLSVKLAGDEDVRTLNRLYRGKDEPTNVLSFGVDPDRVDRPHDELPPLGDVILAFGVVADEAAEFGKKLENHLSHLVVHGVLHLAGYDHDDDEAADDMEALEIGILASLGVGNPYD